MSSFFEQIATFKNNTNIHFSQPGKCKTGPMQDQIYNIQPVILYKNPCPTDCIFNGFGV